MTTHLDVGTRLRRLLAVLTWLTQVGEAPIDEVAARFDLRPETLVAELEMAACCGLPPYTPDQLMEIVVTDTTVSAHLGEMLTRPRRLSAKEGFALAASARALLAVHGSDEDGALSRALSKLDRALGGQPMVVELDDLPMLSVVRDAVDAGRQLAIEYYSASSDEVSERRIDPLRLFASDGHWYLDAHCYKAGDDRRFRVDRIQNVRAAPGPTPSAPPPTSSTPTSSTPTSSTPTSSTPTSSPSTSLRGSEIPAPASSSAGGRYSSSFEPFVPGPEVRSVRLALDPSVAWVVESIPAVTTSVAVGDRIEVEVAVGGDAWLKRLLLRLGPSARVIGPPDAASFLGDAARQILARYQQR